MPDFVVLWTDALIYLLSVVILLFIIVTLRHEHLRAPWRRVTSSKTALSASVVLLVYIFIGLLDTVHFHPRLESDGDEHQYSSEIISLFDVLVEDQRIRHEKTYSAPLATHAFSKENIELPDGTTVRDYPRLKYGGAHLDNPDEEWLGDILDLIIRGIQMGFLIWLGVVLALISIRNWNSREGIKDWKKSDIVITFLSLKPKPGIPWHAASWTWLIICVIFLVLYMLSTQYHVLGTDKVGEDVLYQALKSIRTGLVIGTVTTLVMLPAAILLGIMAGYFKGWVDDVIQYVYTTLASIPDILLIAAAMLIFQIGLATQETIFSADERLVYLCLIMGVTSWTGLCRAIPLSPP